MNHMAMARYALAFLWGTTAVVSITSGRQIGYDILAGAGITGSWAHLCVYGGASLDLLLGGWMLIGVAQLACLRAQATVVMVYTLLLSIIAPAFWLHPFGPLTKNIPLLAFIHTQYQLVKTRNSSAT